MNNFVAHINKYILKFKINIFFMIITSLLSSLFNAFSVVTIIPILYLIEFGNFEEGFSGSEFISNIINKIGIENYEITFFLIIFIIFILLNSIFKIATVYSLSTLKKNIITTLQFDILKNFFSTSFNFYYKVKFYQITSAIQKDLSFLASGVVAYLQQICNFFYLTFLIIVPFIISWKVSLIMLLVMSISILPYVFFNIIYKKIGTKTYRKNNIFTKLFVSYLLSVKFVKTKKLESLVLKNLDKIFKKLLNLDIKLKVTNSIIYELVTLISFISLIITFLVSKKLNIEFYIVIATFFAFFRILPILFNSFVMLGTLKTSEGCFQNIAKLNKLALNNLNIDNNKKSFAFKKISKIKLTNIDYDYPNKKRALNKINYTFSSGNIYGIFGTSGSGKSTLLETILGLNLPKKGKLLVNDIDFNKINLNLFCKKTGFVDSNNQLLSLTIKNNFSILNNELTNREINKLLNFSNSLSFVNKLPRKLNTSIGDTTNLLSSGQKQRICISRALVDSPDLIIFDEGTNHLDKKNEILILEKLKLMKKNKIIIFSTHNKNLKHYFDKILYIENGKIL